MIETISWAFTTLALGCVFAFVARDFLGIYRRKNDLIDRFQAFERNIETRLLSLRQDLEGLETTVQLVDRRGENTLAAHERLLERVGTHEAYTKKEISNLGGQVLDEVRAIKTTQAASYTQNASRITGRKFTP